MTSPCSCGVAALLALVFGAPAIAATPPINCHGATQSIDRAICASPADTALDAEITALYNRGMATFEGSGRHHLAQNQLAYLKQRRGCDWASHHSAHPGPAVDECVRSSMEDRLRLLRAVVDRGGF